MGEKSVIDQKQHLNTIESIVTDLRNLGLKQGMKVVVHSSLSSLGWVNGGPVAMIEALMEVVTEEGMIVMPTQSADLSDPSKWMNPPVPEEWWETIRETMPAYDPKKTTTRAVGRVPEVFRTFPNVLRSDHPSVSFAAWGKGKEEIIHPHPIEYGLGEKSPLGRMYHNNFYVLFIGTDYDTNTSFHLAEFEAKNIQEKVEGAPIIEGGKRVWKEYKELDYDDDRFMEIGKQYEENGGQITIGKIGLATAKLFPQKESIDFAKAWMRKNG